MRVLGAKFGETRVVKMSTIQNIEAVRFLEDIDLSVHPPPDLAIEVDRAGLSYTVDTLDDLLVD